MRQPLFGFDLKRVSLEHYITGKAAINFPHPESTTGGWHFLSYFERDSGVAKVSLAGIHYPDTTDFFGDAGVIDVTDELCKARLVCRRSAALHGGSLSSHRRHDREVGTERVQALQCRDSWVVPIPIRETTTTRDTGRGKAQDLQGWQAAQSGGLAKLPVTSPHRV